MDVTERAIQLATELKLSEIGATKIESAIEDAVAAERERSAKTVIQTGYRLKGKNEYGAGAVAIEAARLIREGKV